MKTKLNDAERLVLQASVENIKDALKRKDLEGYWLNNWKALFLEIWNSHKDDPTFLAFLKETVTEEKLDGWNN